MIAVIPTCRSVNLKHFEPLIDDGVRFFVVDDSEGTVKVDHPQFEVFNWSDRRSLLGKNEIAIPKRNGACRDLGFYIAWKESDADDIIIALDDDCVVESQDFPEQVRSRFRLATRPVLFGNPRFYNHFELFEDPALANLFPRGFPYSERIEYQASPSTKEISAASLFNLGLWKGVPDVNAIDKIGLDRCEFPEPGLRFDNVVMPYGTLTCLCSGNMQFRREVIPAIYQLPMMIEIMPNWPIDRYGDIWGGHILKTLLDVRGDRMSVGGPLVRHLRAGPLQPNIRREHLSHLVSEEFVDLLLRLETELKPQSYLDMMAQVQEFFAINAEGVSPILSRYLRCLEAPLAAWINILRN